MKLRYIIPGLLILLITHFAYGFEGRVVSVTDGDTIKVLTNDHTQYKVRLYGVDAPESKQPFGKVSKGYLAGLVAGKIVEVGEAGKDMYGRTIGKVYCGGEYVNAAMVRAGMAWHYKDYAPRDTELRDAQAEACKGRLGLWSEENPAPPWEFRKRRKSTP